MVVLQIFNLSFAAVSHILFCLGLVGLNGPCMSWICCIVRGVVCVSSEWEVLVVAGGGGGQGTLCLRKDVFVGGRGETGKGEIFTGSPLYHATNPFHAWPR